VNHYHHSSFTPSESDGETLEHLFVARERLAGSVLESIRESATSGNKHQRLLIGPRGIGKTHFVALMNHRVTSDPEMLDRLWIAWLNEDPYVAGYAHFLMEIARALAGRYGDRTLEDALERVLDYNDEGLREAELVNQLVKFIGDRTLLLIMENFDDILNALGDEGQKKLRAFIQNKRSVTILATATSLNDAVSDRERAFFGFFRINNLEPLSVDEAVALLTRLAERQDDVDLATALNSPMGFARIRAVHYLAGGNPRIYALFFDFLERDTLDDLVRPFMKLIDDLTPYYQSRMDRLAPLQRRILDTLRRYRGAATVKEIARQAMSTPQSISSQLGKLEDLGYVLKQSKGRNNFYEMREPLMRLCLEVKDQGGRSVGLFVQFLRVWYSELELDQLVHGNHGDGFLIEAARRAREEEDPLQSSLAAEFLAHQSSGNHEKALAAAVSATERNPRSKESWLRRARCLDILKRPHDERLACWQRITELDPDDWEGWHRVGMILFDQEGYEESLEALLKALDLEPEKPRLYREVSNSLAFLGREEEARQYWLESIQWEDDPKTSREWDARGTNLWLGGRQEKAIEAYLRSIELDPYDDRAWGHLLGAFQETGRFGIQSSTIERYAALDPDNAAFCSYLGHVHAIRGESHKAIDLFDRALTLDPDLDREGYPATLAKARELNRIGEPERAMELVVGFKPHNERFNLQREIQRACSLLTMRRLETAVSVLQDLIRNKKSVGWASNDLYPLFYFPLRNRLAHSDWRKIIPLFLLTFATPEWSIHIGRGLVRSLSTLRFDWMNEALIRDWLSIWKELAGHMEEMAIPLQILGAGIDYYATGDQSSLLRIPKEQRGLLEPWLYNIVDPKPEPEIESRLDRILLKLERHFDEEAEKKLRATFWEQAAPVLGPRDIKGLVSQSGDLPKRRPLPLIADSWAPVDRGDALTFLEVAASSNENVARSLARPDLRVLALERRSLAFTDWSLFQLTFEEEGAIGSIDLMASDEEVVLLEGLSPIVYELVSKKVIGIREATAPEYLRFFCGMLRGGDGRFHLIEEIETLMLVDSGDLPKGVDIQALEPIEAPEGDENPRYSVTMLYGGVLFRAILSVNLETGMVEMLDDEPLTEKLFWTETMDGPLRFLDPPSGGRRP